MKVLAALGLATVSASTCTEMVYTVYTDNKCTGTAAATLTAKDVPIGSCHQADFGLAGWATLASQKEYIRVDYCKASATDVKGGVFFHTTPMTLARLPPPPKPPVPQLWEDPPTARLAQMVSHPQSGQSSSAETHTDSDLEPVSPSSSAKLSSSVSALEHERPTGFS